jgi:hypothetical protein
VVGCGGLVGTSKTSQEENETGKVSGISNKATTIHKPTTAPVADKERFDSRPVPLHCYVQNEK